MTHLGFFDRLILKLLYMISNTHIILYLFTIIVTYTAIVLILPVVENDYKSLFVSAFFFLLIEIGLINSDFDKEFKQHKNYLRLKRVKFYKKQNKLKNEEYEKRVDTLRQKAELYSQQKDFDYDKYLKIK